jgi:hypothetical protein
VRAQAAGLRIFPPAVLVLFIDKATAREPAPLIRVYFTGNSPGSMPLQIAEDEGYSFSIKKLFSTNG